MSDPVDRRVAEILESQNQRLLARELVDLLSTEVASATKYPATIEREHGGVIVLSYCKVMLGNTVRKEVAELHLKHGNPDKCEVVLSNAVLPPSGFEHGAWYEFKDAAELVVRALIESMAQSIAAGCKIVESTVDHS